MPATLRALVYRPGSLGDTIVSLPAIAEIRRRYPEHRLTLLTEHTTPASRRVSPWAILGETGWFEGVERYYVKAAGTRAHWHNVSLAMRLRANAYDAVFSLAPPRTDAQLRNDARILHTLLRPRAYHAAARPSWPMSALPPDQIEREGLRLLRIVDPDATEESLNAFRLPIPAAELSKGQHLLSALGVGENHVLVGVAPGSGRAATKWPAERFAAVGRALLDEFTNLVLITLGGSNERSLCGELCEAWGPRSHNLAGRLSVFESASVLTRCTTFIGNDSGSTHLAASIGVPCVAIFSARNPPGQWLPAGGEHVVLEERPACAGCMLDECVEHQNECLSRIDSGRVLREAARLIHARTAAAW